MHHAFIGLGSNLGDRLDNLSRAATLCARCGTITAVSPVYATAPVGFTEQPEFWNAVLRLETGLEPRPLFAALQQIEHEAGRVPSFAGGPRLIDLDILLIGDVIHAEPPVLVVPHPRMHERAFVLRPLTDIAPDLRHPVIDTTVAHLLELVSDQAVRMLPHASRHLAELLHAPARRASDGNG